MSNSQKKRKKSSSSSNSNNSKKIYDKNSKMLFFIGIAIVVLMVMGLSVFKIATVATNKSTPEKKVEQTNNKKKPRQVKEETNEVTVKVKD